MAVGKLAVSAAAPGIDSRRVYLVSLDPEHSEGADAAPDWRRGRWWSFARSSTYRMTAVTTPYLTA